MNRSVAWLALCQGLLLTNNVVFIAVNGLVGLALAPWPWMATLPVMGYVVGGALATPLVATAQRRWGRHTAFQLGLLVALLSAALCAVAAYAQQFVLLCASTVIAGYYNANGQLYRFAAAELVGASQRERAISLVLAGGLLGAVLGPALASHARGWFATPFLGVYVALMGVALLGLACMSRVRFPQRPQEEGACGAASSRTVARLLAQPGFAVAALCASVSYGVMNLLMAATPLAMQVCGHDFTATAEVLQWHVVGMFAPGFVTGHLIKRMGVLPIMGLGVAINLACVGVALSGQSVMHFLWAMALLGLGWNFLFTGSTSLVMRYYRPEERDRAEAAMNFCVFAVMAATSLASGALATSGGWDWLNWGSLLALILTAWALVGLARRGL
ncbi:MAG: MFS transporter [Hydrogenophaga sp. SCN 70-13]|uniref:MFS transporter n=1 Tax=unclassified Hydrogenophaga TaxID=2610897 RepID=UPI00086D4904|nr:MULTISPECIES: MFS transporter [unclassified Hydrogenophaga]MBN9371433.1 MFS transporter [Hydrogenophaga sp.]ODT32222.1 MAG: MFS transporter [Hydrogenophaga sp. SCN 70-13]OJV38957.1 MAG: MFS transporter [Hydrogenophaga sp. 70-12]